MHVSKASVGLLRAEDLWKFPSTKLFHVDKRADETVSLMWK